jgi:hypothetical protein
LGNNRISRENFSDILREKSQHRRKELQAMKEFAKSLGFDQDKKGKITSRKRALRTQTN